MTNPLVRQPSPNNAPRPPWKSTSRTNQHRQVSGSRQCTYALSTRIFAAMRHGNNDQCFMTTHLWSVDMSTTLAPSTSKNDTYRILYLRVEHRLLTEPNVRFRLDRRSCPIIFSERMQASVFNPSMTTVGPRVYVVDQSTWAATLIRRYKVYGP